MIEEGGYEAAAIPFPGLVAVPVVDFEFDALEAGDLDREWSGQTGFAQVLIDDAAGALVGAHQPLFEAGETGFGLGGDKHADDVGEGLRQDAVAFSFLMGLGQRLQPIDDGRGQIKSEQGVGG